MFQKRTLEIVGVLGDVRNQTLCPAGPELYVPIDQWGWRDGVVFVRTAIEPRAVEARARSIVRAMNPSIPLVTVRTLADRVRLSMAPERFRAILHDLTPVAVRGSLARSHHDARFPGSGFPGFRVPTLARMTDLIPPRMLKSPTTSIHLGRAHAERSSRIRFTARS